MTNDEILQVAMRQSAIDSSCFPDDFMASENRVVISKPSADARKYLELPFLCDLTSYGGNIVASVSEELNETVRSYIDRFPVEQCFETPNLHVLMDTLRPLGMNVCFMAEYFLPDVGKLESLGCGFRTELLCGEEFAGLYLPQWSNALCEKRKELDRLAVGAYDGDKLIGLAGCSADCLTMWQIGVDVLPEYRRRGIASALTSRLALEILRRGKVPFYCAAWSNVRSVRNAIRSGFKPAWVQLTVKSQAYIEEMQK